MLLLYLYNVLPIVRHNMTLHGYMCWELNAQSTNTLDSCGPPATIAWFASVLESGTHKAANTFFSTSTLLKKKHQTRLRCYCCPLYQKMNARSIVGRLLLIRWFLLEHFPFPCVVHDVQCSSSSILTCNNWWILPYPGNRMYSLSATQLPFSHCLVVANTRLQTILRHQLQTSSNIS